MREFAFAIEIACFTALATESESMSLVAAKPQVPFAMTRTPTPDDSVLTTFCTLSSRVITNWRRYRPMRTSQYEAPLDFAVASATSASFFFVAASIFVSSTSAATCAAVARQDQRAEADAAHLDEITSIHCHLPRFA